MGTKTIKYRKQDKPGLQGTSFKVSLNIKDIPLMSVLTTDLVKGHDMLIWKAEDNLYTVRLLVRNKNTFFPPELLKPGQELHIITKSDITDKITIV